MGLVEHYLEITHPDNMLEDLSNEERWNLAGVSLSEMWDLVKEDLKIELQEEAEIESRRAGCVLCGGTGYKKVGLYRYEYCEHIPDIK